MNPHYPLVAGRAAHRCEYCQAPESVFNFPFEVEHNISRASGGEDIESNWALCCRGCNLFKSNHRHAIDPLRGEAVSLFHPRTQHWEDHFTIDGSTVIGSTAIGRATVDLLQMNRSAQLAARHQWSRLQLFPPGPNH